MTDTASQIAEQYRAVAHMATRIVAEIEANPSLADNFMGQRSSDAMEALGNAMNELGGLVVADARWLLPIFKEAQRLWPPVRKI